MKTDELQTKQKNKPVVNDVETFVKYKHILYMHFYVGNVAVCLHMQCDRLKSEFSIGYCVTVAAISLLLSPSHSLYFNAVHN